MKTSIRIAIMGSACFLILALAAVTARADRGDGSIRAAARPATPPARDVHPEAPHPAPENRPAPRSDARPAAPPRAVTPPRAAAPAHRDWDDNDDNNAKSWGGLAHGAPAPVIRGQRVHDLPASHRIVVINHRNYEYGDDGAYYLQQPDGDYLTVQPPLSAMIPALPDGVISIPVGPTTYYYLDGVFYVAQDGSFAVVNPPAGIVVPSLPTGASQVVINGVVAYQFNGFSYQPSIQDGVTVYTVAAM